MASYQQRGKRWYVRIRRKGGDVCCRTFDRKVDGERWAAEIEAPIIAGRYQRPSTKTMAELFAWYRNTILPGHAESSTDAYRLKKIEKHFAAEPMLDVTPFECVSFAKNRLAEGMASDTIRRDLGLLSDAFNSAQAFGFATVANPVTLAFTIIRKLRLLSAPVHRDRRVLDGEEQKLLTAASGDMRDLIVFAIIEPLRQSEIFRMRRQDVDWRQHTLTIWRSKTDWKTGQRGRIVPLLPEAFAILDARPARIDGQIWVYTDSHSISQAFARLCRKVGISGLRFHDLKHEATSRLFERGFTIEQVSVWTGHKDWRSLKRYTHPDPAKLAAQTA